MFENTGTARERQARQIPLIIIDRLRPTNLEDEIPAYTAISTATNNVEDDEYQSALTNLNLDSESSSISAERLTEQTETHLHEIAKRLVKNLSPEIVIAVHGFNNNLNSTQVWYRELHQYINHDSTIRNRDTVFIGYRWPAENFLDRLILNIVNAFEALPSLPKNTFLSSLVTSFLLLIVLLIFYKDLLLLIFGVTTVITSLILTLIILRLVVYFRDSYRASYFGTPDLVELVRQLDKVIYHYDQKRK